mmetsp:Transcript_26147/g.57100  ORF Transcript_26147/g.57100 Transcript_26147/m.57100 type:complete len:205 (+) Transcript_26147:124-738(+)
MTMAMTVLLERVILAGIAPLVRTAMAKHVREVMVVKVDAVGIAVVILPVRLAIHEDLHGLAPLLNVSDGADAQHWRDGANHLHTRRQERVEEALHILHEADGLESVLRIEVHFGIDRRVVDAADYPRRAVERTHDGIVQAHDRVGAPQPPVRPHRLLARQGEVGPDGLDWAMCNSTALRQRRDGPCSPAEQAGHLYSRSELASC